MKGFLHWFKSSTKVKRWIFLVLLGMILFCFGFTNVILGDTLEPKEMIYSALAFVVGFTFSIVGLIFIQKRNLELIIEASEKKVNLKGKEVDITSLIFNKKVYEKGPNIVVVGSGNGVTSVLSGLKKYTSNIKAIVAVSDYGKTPTASRQYLELLPMGDIKDSIIALASEHNLMSELLKHEFENPKLRELNFGDVYLYAMRDLCGNFSEAVQKSSNILNITGEVLPVTLDEMQICAELENGMIVEEKMMIPKIVSEKITKIKRVFVSPTNCRVSPGVLEAIREADAIVIGPGSLYTNVIPNLLIKTVSKEIKTSKAKKIYVSNIMTEPGQTDNYSLSDHISAIEEHATEQLIDYCICDTGEIVPEFVRKYNKYGSDIVDQDFAKVKQKGIVVIPRNLSCIENEHIRHDSDLVSAAIIELVCNELRFKDKQNEMKFMVLDNKLKREKKTNPKLKQKNKTIAMVKAEQAKRSRFKKKSKFESKYSERINSIKSSDKKSLEEVKKMENKENKKRLQADKRREKKRNKKKK